MVLNVSIGIDDFRTLRELGLEYVDKTCLVRELIDRPGAQVVLFPRPRRFGKSLNLSMLRCFFEKRGEDFSGLFEGLEIWRAGEPYRAHFQRYPVIHLTFKGAKQETFEGTWGAIAKKIQVLFDEHRSVLDSPKLTERQVADFRAVVGGTADRALYDRALLDLCDVLHTVHGEKAVILIDEYDEPIHAGYLGGFARPIIEFFRAFFTNGLKGNPHLARGVLTGILRIARESIFSGLNNLAVFSLLRSELSTCFGFTEGEVEALLLKAGREDRLEEVRRWYNGYIFGDSVVYNPWSVLNFLADAKGECRPYWVSTSSNDLVKHLLGGRAGTLTPIFESLMAGGGVDVVLDENVVLDRLETSDAALWSLLVFSGYLKARQLPRMGDELAPHHLTIPNLEVRTVYRGAFREWLEAALASRGGRLDRMIRGLLEGDAEVFEEELQRFADNLLSYHDTGRVHAEQVYQGFIIGLLAALEPEHRVRSNRESGRGRPDVLITPARPGLPGVVLELKVAKPGKKAPEQALAEGMAQLRDNDYAAELRAAGATPIHAFAVAFDGKQVWVRSPEGG